MKKILILGGSSDIGVDLISKLISDQNIIHAQYNSNKPKFKNKNLKFIKLNLKNLINLDKKIDNDYDIIINLVGYIEKSSFSKFDLEKICHSYIRGLEWILIYYKDRIPDWNWFYKWAYAPFLSDLVKLKQDLHHLWAVHNQDVYTVRIHQIYEYIWDRLEVRYADYLTESFHILDVLNALRIEPYLTSDSQRVILEGIVKSTELYAISYCSDGGTINQISEIETEVDVVTSYDKSFDGNRSD